MLSLDMDGSLKFLSKNKDVSFYITGRFEILLGGWVMPDEASTHYISVIDQLTEGHQWLKENLGIMPNNSWSIDPFGHSGTMPYLWRKAGMKNMVIQRIHQSTKGQMIKEKGLEFYWKQYWDSNTKNGHDDKDSIFCHVMPYMLYSLHHTCGPDKYTCIMFDFRQVPGEMGQRYVLPVDKDNIANKAKALYEQYRLKGSLFKHDTILVPLGDDFRYNKLEEWDQQYENYQKLMEFMNAKKEWKIQVKFGTVSDFFKATHESEKNDAVAFPSLSGDFYPYSDHDNAYWTGYFTTRPFDKRFARETESRLRAAEIVHSLAISYSAAWKTQYVGLGSMPPLLQTARRNLGLFLHHDAITGTGKAYVVEDYEEKLFEAYENAMTVIGSASQYLLTKGKINTQPSVFQPEMSRVSPKAPSMRNRISPTSEGVRVVMFNPTGHFRSEFVDLVVDTVQLEIKDSKRKNIPFQINPVYTTTTEVDRTTFEIVFLTEIPAFGLETFVLRTINRTPNSFWSKITVYNSDEFIVGPELLFDQSRPRRRGNMYESILIENKYIGAEFKSVNGLLTKYVEKTGNRTRKIDVVLDFKQYSSRGSGAYIFFPLGPAKDLLPGLPVIRVVEGPYSSEVQTVFKNIYHRVKLYKHPGLQGRYLYIQNTLDMFYLNMRDKEPIMRFSSSVHNEPGNFFTDQNGFQYIGRKRHPSDPNLNRIERNYYPATTMSFIQDTSTRLTLHFGQPLGVASLGRGELEVMMDRQLLYDDQRGLGEGISDNKLTMTKFILQVERTDSPMSEEKFSYPSLQSVVINEFLNQPLQIMYTQINSDVMSLKFSPLQHSLPCDIFVVTMKSLLRNGDKHNGTGLIVHRRGFKCGFPDDGLQCSEREVNVAGFFPTADTSNVKETTLTHTAVKETPVQLNSLNVPPMELSSYLIDAHP